MTNDRTIHEDENGCIQVTQDGTGYIVADDSGWLEGTFRTLHDAYSALGLVPPEYPIAEGDYRVESEPEPEPAQKWCVHCHGWFTEEGLAEHLSPEAGGKVNCPVLYGPKDDFSDLQARARALRERGA